MDGENATLELSDEEKDLLSIASDYTQLLKCPGYKRLLDYLERVSNVRLARLRRTDSRNSLEQLKELRYWQIWEEVLAVIQKEILAKIEARDSLVSDILRSRGMSEERISEILKSQLIGVI